MFDDAFSALDMKTDAKLRTALKEITGSAVVLIVAQRVSTIKDADRIVVLDNGRIVGKGKHLELLRSCKVYKEIVKSQFSDREFQTELKLADKYAQEKKTRNERAKTTQRKSVDSGASNIAERKTRTGTVPGEVEYA